MVLRLEGFGFFWYVYEGFCGCGILFFVEWVYKMECRGCLWVYLFFVRLLGDCGGVLCVGDWWVSFVVV